ncbi:AAA family ATPase [Sphingobium sufflavum]|uniref:chromosome segregation SMC family protein n=1 Tax=Sphingobium sufflavum TaxID=1129547 RepID=UPI001F3ED4C3|nr:AAA family ATPase [Sphingobium sufflavum]MCE7795318.1 AAA family ATPase [Sphingobium sufflavum]
MRLTRLKLSGFKSFVEPADLLIEPGLTGIVGPNGCGKSNLLEAIRWVMGEASARTLRGGAMEDVIFAGTTKRPRRDFAEVTIIAENVAPMPGVGDGMEDGAAEIIRRIERGAGSAYRINGRDVRAKDVALLFADAATGAHSPALVSQGRIAAVIAAKPQERRAMLEEAAGIAGLHVRRKDAETKLRATEANLARLAEIMADMEGRANSLRRQARAAEKYRELTTRITLAEARALFARYRAAIREEEQAMQASTAADAGVTGAQGEQAAAATAQRDAAETLNARRIAVQEARDAALAARHTLDKLTAQRRTVERRITDLATQLQRLDADRDRETALDRDAAAASQRLTAEAEGLAARVATLDATIPDLAGRIATADLTVREAEVALAQAMARRAAEQAERRVAEAAMVAARHRLERASVEAKTIDDARAALPDLAPIEGRIAAARAARTVALANAETAERAIAAAEDARVIHAAGQERHQGALSAARATLAALDAEAVALRKATQSVQGSSKAIDRVRAAPGYERALAAALGDALNAPIGADGPMRWAGAAPMDGDPAVPADCTCLADKVDAPAELARALALTLVAEVDDGRPLAAGQRFVTLAGHMRRWDGYVIADRGAATAERFIRLNRLDAIAAERPGHAATVEAHAAALATAEAALRQSLIDQRTARLTAGEAREATRAAEKLMDEQSAVAERLTQRRADLDRRAQEQSGEMSAARIGHEQATMAVSDLPDGMAIAEEINRHNNVCEGGRRFIVELRSELALAERGAAEQRERLKAVAAEQAGWRTRAADAIARLADMAARRDSLSGEYDGLVDRPAALLAEQGEADADVKTRNAKVAAESEAEKQSDALLKLAEEALAAATETLARAREQRASAAARAENATHRRMEIGGQCGERFHCPPPVLPERFAFAADSVEAAEREQDAFDRLTAERERMGPVNLVAAQELEEMEAEQARSAAESEELQLAVNRLRGSVGSLNREGRQRLLAAFEAVNEHFQRLFTTLFNGGQAHLALVDSDDPLEAGLEIFAQPPGKKLAALTLLSGGEQALTAVALIFGLFLTNPAPICVLDEVDAPLDDANVGRFCDLLDRMARDTQTRYLVVTHNAVTMSRMHRLFGVTMVEQGVSRLVSVDLGGAEALLSEPM